MFILVCGGQEFIDHRPLPPQSQFPPPILYCTFACSSSAPTDSSPLSLETKSNEEIPEEEEEDDDDDDDDDLSHTATSAG